MAHQPLIHTIYQQQDLDLLVTEYLQVGAVLCGSITFSSDVLDLVLSWFHAGQVVFQ